MRIAKAVVILAIFVLLQTGAATAQKRVERPYKAHAQVTVVVSINGVPNFSGPWPAIERGEATHLGQFLSLDIVTPEGNNTGTIIAANGDKIFWTSSPGAPGTWTGGTGRFQGVTGGLTSAQFSDPVLAFDPVLGEYTVTQTYESEGTITY